MTAEMAIMNKEAIALAADSAVTLTGERGRKVFTSANKIFTLSKAHPVGVMIYGSASFMGVPWETIVKVYRAELGQKVFDRLGECAEDFLHFLRRWEGLSGEGEQDRYLRTAVYSYLRLVKDKIYAKVDVLIQEKQKVTHSEITRITSETIKKHYEIWRSAALVPGIRKRHTKQLRQRLNDICREAKKRVFEKLPVTKRSSQHLTQLVLHLFQKFPEEYSHTGLSGVVIAGFGAREIFPSLRSFLLEGVIDGQLKYRKSTSVTVAHDNEAAIVPFAQTEMAYTFMEGVDPRYEEAIEADLSKIFHEYPVVLIDRITKLDERDKKKLTRQLQETGSQLAQQYVERLGDYRKDHFVKPIISVVAKSPKDELAAMAESLVSLTLFKRRVSPEAETVSEPIDVAVISKGDGFIWIKRKHYFEADRNPQFFANYFRRS